MPFGLTNAPATLQRLMESCLGDLHLTWCIIYLDDIIIFSKNPDDHITRLEGVFEKLAEAGLKLKPSKCEFFKARLKYLGHAVSPQGIATDPAKIEAILKWPRPKTVTDVRSFTGFTNYYHKFIKGYAKVAQPLHELTSGENVKIGLSNGMTDVRNHLRLLRNYAVPSFSICRLLQAFCSTYRC